MMNVNMFHTPTTEKSHHPTSFSWIRRLLRLLEPSVETATGFSFGQVGFFLEETSRQAVFVFLQFKAGDDSKVAAAASAATRVYVCVVCVC